MDVVKDITLLVAIRWIAFAWSKVQPHTIINVSGKQGFLVVV